MVLLTELKSKERDRQPINISLLWSEKRTEKGGRPALLIMLRAIAIILGIVLAAVGGVIAYRAYFLEPTAAVIISERGVQQLPDTYRMIEGIALLIVGAAMAFIAARRRPKK